MWVVPRQKAVPGRGGFFNVLKEPEGGDIGGKSQDVNFKGKFLHFERRGFMLGMADGWTALVWLLNVASMILCVVYGAVNWNKGGEDW
jgi:hypothetical protein